MATLHMDVSIAAFNTAKLQHALQASVEGIVVILNSEKPDIPLLADLLYGIARVLELDLLDAFLVVDIMKEAEKLEVAASECTKAEMFNVVRIAAGVARYTNNLDLSLHLFKKALSFAALEKRTSVEVAKVHAEIASLQTALQNHVAALASLDRAINLAAAEKLPIKEGTLTQWHHDRCGLLLKQSRLFEAETALTRAVEIRATVPFFVEEKIKSPAEMQVEMANIKLRQGLPHQALEFLAKATSQNALIDSKKLAVEIHVSTVHAQLQLGNAPAAQESIGQAKFIATSNLSITHPLHADIAAVEVTCK